MTKIIGPDFVALQVRDLDASKEFYTKVLGMEPAPQSPPGAVVFNTTPIPFAIRKPSIDLDATSRLGWGVALWLKVDDADGLFQALTEKRVKIVTPIQDGAFGRQFAFMDPDGYVITIHAG